MFCEWDCYMVGGPWISENPNCPRHGVGSNDRKSEIHEILIRVWNRELSADDGYDQIESLI